MEEGSVTQILTSSNRARQIQMLSRKSLLARYSMQALCILKTLNRAQNMAAAK